MHMYISTSAEWVIIVSGNGLAPDRHRVITCPNVYLLSTFQNKIQWNLNVFSQQIAFRKVVCKPVHTVSEVINQIKNLFI